MRVAFIAHYQGPLLQRTRPCLNNLSLGSKIKVELITQLLRKSGHDVEIISPGEVDADDMQARLKFYPSFLETQPFDAAVPIFYASALSVRYLAGAWSANSTAHIFLERHRKAPFDVVIIHTLKPGQLACARNARKRLHLPVILEYEDDVFVNVVGEEVQGLIRKYHRYRYRKTLRDVSGCMAVSPHLLSQLSVDLPKLLLRGIVNEHIVSESNSTKPRKNWVVFSGTHEGAQGLAPLIEAWRIVHPPGWELHIAGNGPITPALKKMAEGDRTIVFHGFLDSSENARLLSSAKIGMNPQDVTKVPGTSFAFKIIEYLAAGLHVVTTPRGNLEPALEAAVTYIDDNTPAKIACCLTALLREHGYTRTARQEALNAYGPDAISQGLNRLLHEVTAPSI